jgi:hypothetical protein
MTWPLKLSLAGNAALLALCGWLYVSGQWAVDAADKRTEAAKAELGSLQAALADAKSAAQDAMLEATRRAEAERTQRYDDLLKAGVDAATSIAAATKGDAAPGDVDPDGALPQPLIEPLWVLYDKICAGGKCGVTVAPPVQRQANAEATRDGP